MVDIKEFKATIQRLNKLIKDYENTQEQGELNEIFMDLVLELDNLKWSVFDKTSRMED